LSENLDSYYAFLVETAYIAGRSSLMHFQTGVIADYKADNSPVTLADKTAEMIVRTRIEKAYPTHAIVGEEFGATERVGASHRWIVDPIDGTKSFIRGIPLYAVLIGLEIDGRLTAGAAYFPALDEMLSAADGLGCWWNGRRAHVSAISRLKEAWVTSTDPGGYRDPARADAWKRLMAAAYCRGGWGDAYGYLLVATGRVEVMIDPIMELWDCGPFPPIFREAGGYFGDWEGHETIYGREALATNKAVLNETLSLLGG
jgi:histidinol-phosphatase